MILMSIENRNLPMIVGSVEARYHRYIEAFNIVIDNNPHNVMKTIHHMGIILVNDVRIINAISIRSMG